MFGKLVKKSAAKYGYTTTVVKKYKPLTYAAPGCKERVSTWKTRELAESVATHYSGAIVVPYKGRFSVEVPYDAKIKKAVKPFTEKQFTAWLESQRGWAEDLEVAAEDAAGDIAAGILALAKMTGSDEAWAAAYLQAAGVEDILGALADYLYDVAK